MLKQYMYGSEYQDNVLGNNLHDKDVPCAVCISNMATNILMIQGKSVCINGWKKESNGRLASKASSDDGFKAAGQYVFIIIIIIPRLLTEALMIGTGNYFTPFMQYVVLFDARHTLIMSC